MSFVTRFAKAKAVSRGGIYTFIERVTLFALRTPFVARKTFFVSIRTFFTVARKIAFTFADADMIISTNKPVRTGDALRAFSHHTQPVIPTDLTVGTGIDRTFGDTFASIDFTNLPGSAVVFGGTPVETHARFTANLPIRTPRRRTRFHASPLRATHPAFHTGIGVRTPGFTQSLDTYRVIRARMGVATGKSTKTVMTANLTLGTGIFRAPWKTDAVDTHRVRSAQTRVVTRLQRPSRTIRASHVQNGNHTSQDSQGLHRSDSTPIFSGALSRPPHRDTQNKRKPATSQAAGIPCRDRALCRPVSYHATPGNGTKNMPSPGVLHIQTTGISRQNTWHCHCTPDLHRAHRL